MAERKTASFVHLRVKSAYSLLEGAVRWVVAPEEVAWTLPDSYALQRMIVDSLFIRPNGFPHLPRQLSTARRAA